MSTKKSKTDGEMVEDKKHILELFPQDLEEFLLEKNYKKFRINQISNWLYNKNEIDFNKMTSLSKDFRAFLDKTFDNFLPEIVRHQKSIDGSEKFLLKLPDDNTIEMVKIPAGKKNTLCISSQVGCARNCSFCATAKLGLKRNLKVHEILSQIFIIKRHLGEEKLTNIVFMGMGEPLDNYDNVVKSVRILQNEKAFSFSPRRITISTCGVVPGINKLSTLDLKVKLAVSLNSAIDATRSYLMPINNTYPLKNLKRALKEYSYTSTFRITFEYIMIPDFNMSDADVKAIMRFAGDLKCKINLIPWNPVEGLPYRSATNKEIEEFQYKLMKIDKAVTIRKSRGSDIDGACGQLAGRSEV